MRAHVVENNLIVNTLEVLDLSFPVGKGQTLVEAIGREGIGWEWNDGRPVDVRVFPEPPVPPKTEIELRIEALEAAKVDHEARLKAVEEKPGETVRLRAEVAKMDLDGDGSIGGSKPRA